MRKLIYPALFIQTLLLLALSINIYFELTNPRKINDWYDAVLSESLDNLTDDQAFAKLSKHGFRVIEKYRVPSGETETEIAPPYQVGIIGFFMIRIPFNFVIRINSNGIVSSYGIKK